VYDRKTIDILVSNAAVSPVAAPISNTPPDIIDKILDINVKAAVMLVQVSQSLTLRHIVFLSVCFARYLELWLVAACGSCFLP
jgi:NAD(P)-dependent dehydrogenase (short-subunit alcohol dehydrogenase family)